MKDAMDAEKGGSILTCQAIIKAVIGVGVDEEDRKDTWYDFLFELILFHQFDPEIF
jgi:pre-mRNA-processing factor 6